INGNRIDEGNGLRNVIASAAPGSEVTLTVLREGREQQLRATLGELPSQTPGRSPGGSGQGGGSGGADRLGLSVTPMTPELATRREWWLRMLTPEGLQATRGCRRAT